MSSAKTVNDFNREYLYRCWLEEVESVGQPGKGQTVKTAAFYLVLVGMVFMAFLYSGNKTPGRSFGPFAYNSVLTTSMQSVYPQGSIIFSWAVKPEEPLKAGLVDGDDIVLIKEDGTVIVHRIIEIMYDYEDLGVRAFRTQGVDNRSPDSWITLEVNVIGRVRGHVPILGNVLLIIADNTLWVAGGVVVLFGIITLLKVALKKEPHTEQAE
ncbi:MAG: signal peptidase I [Clostridiales bacterium]|nr:signal peptidase I [Clostridiales bacterium]